MTRYSRDILIRSYREGDAPELGQVFHRAVHEGAASHYSEAERLAWSPAPPASRAWEERLAGAETVVAETAGHLVGVMSLDLDRAYLDLAFVLPGMSGRGVGNVLYAVLEGRARATGVTRIETEASLRAEGFFLGRGFQVEARQQVERRGVLLSNARMTKTLISKQAAA